jgi:carbamoylphosphate synthase large subunit
METVLLLTAKFYYFTVWSLQNNSSIEFERCSVSFVRNLRGEGLQFVMTNYTPEIVSTEYQGYDCFYISELSFERVLDIHVLEGVSGIFVSMGGQIPNEIALQLHLLHTRILGTTPELIDGVESCNVYHECSTESELISQSVNGYHILRRKSGVGYPGLVRPSFVLSGAAMNVFLKADDFEEYLNEASEYRQNALT